MEVVPSGIVVDIVAAKVNRVEEKIEVAFNGCDLPYEVLQKSSFIGDIINHKSRSTGLLKIRRHRIQQHTDMKKYRER